LLKLQLKIVFDFSFYFPFLYLLASILCPVCLPASDLLIPTALLVLIADNNGILTTYASAAKKHLTIVLEGLKAKTTSKRALEYIVFIVSGMWVSIFVLIPRLHFNA
jgi:hypothetical protein